MPKAEGGSRAVRRGQRGEPRLSLRDISPRGTGGEGTAERGGKRVRLVQRILNALFDEHVSGEYHRFLVDTQKAAVTRSDVHWPAGAVQPRARIISSR